MDSRKPPIGCKPYYVAIPERIDELCDAIKTYASVPDGHNNVRLWCSEILLLNEMDRTLRYNEKQKTWTVDKAGQFNEMT